VSDELIHVKTPRALAGGEAHLDAINESIASNISAGGISDIDLHRVTISGGPSPRWAATTLDGEKLFDRIYAVIAFARDTRAFYRTPFGRSGGKQPPDCTSTDGIMGRGNPGGECSRCPFAEFGSAEDGPGQACKQVKQLFVLHGDLLLPEIVSLPPTSLKAARQFFLKLLSEGIPYYTALVALELEKAQNGAGIQYGRAVLKFVRRLSQEEAGRAQRYHDLCRSLSVRVPTGLDPEARE
jgi:hypothetical protein